jgi:hypothetical protein
MDLNIPSMNIGVTIQVGTKDAGGVRWKGDPIPALITNWGMLALSDHYACNLFNTVVLGSDGTSLVRSFVGSQRGNTVNGVGFSSGDVGKYILYPSGEQGEIVKYLNANQVCVDIYRTLGFTNMEIADLEQSSLLAPLQHGSLTAIDPLANSSSNSSVLYPEYGIRRITNQRSINKKLSAAATVREIGITLAGSIQADDPNVFARAVCDYSFEQNEVVNYRIIMRRDVFYKDYRVNRVGIAGINCGATVVSNLDSTGINSTMYSTVGVTGATVVPLVEGVPFERKCMDDSRRTALVCSKQEYVPYKGMYHNYTNIALTNTINAIDMSADPANNVFALVANGVHRISSNGEISTKLNLTGTPERIYSYAVDKFAILVDGSLKLYSYTNNSFTLNYTTTGMDALAKEIDGFNTASLNIVDENGMFTDASIFSDDMIWKDEGFTLSYLYSLSTTQRSILRINTSTGEVTIAYTSPIGILRFSINKDIGSLAVIDSNKILSILRFEPEILMDEVLADIEANVGSSTIYACTWISKYNLIVTTSNGIYLFTMTNNGLIAPWHQINKIVRNGRITVVEDNIFIVEGQVYHIAAQEITPLYQITSASVNTYTGGRYYYVATNKVNILTYHPIALYSGANIVSHTVSDTSFDTATVDAIGQPEMKLNSLAIMLEGSSFILGQILLDTPQSTVGKNVSNLKHFMKWGRIMGSQDFPYYA